MFLQDENGLCGIGEIAPLENFSKETIKDCIRQIKVISELIREQNLEDIFKRCYPSVRFGLELAVLSLEANKKGKNLFELLSKDSRWENKRVKLNALITEQNIYELERLLESGYSSFKIKVRAEKDWRLVKQVRDKVGCSSEIRLDANRTFSLEEGVRFGKKVYPLRIAYIEDPVRPTELKEFFEQTNIAVAVDQGIESKEIRYGKHIKAWIIKPGISVGIKESIALIREAQSLGIMPILSNPFYSGVGVSALACISSAFIDEDIAMGFDPYRWIKEDILEDPLNIKNGSFYLKDVLKKMFKINTKKLDLLYTYTSYLS